MLAPECSLPHDDDFHLTFLRLALRFDTCPTSLRPTFVDALQSAAQARRRCARHVGGRPRSGSIVYHGLYCNSTRRLQPRGAAARAPDAAAAAPDTAFGGDSTHG